MSTLRDQLLTKRDQATAEVTKLDKLVGWCSEAAHQPLASPPTTLQIYQGETEYLQADYTLCGTVFKGFEGFLSSKDAIRKRNRMLRVEDRLWSLSSRTSPAVLELEQQLAESLPDTMSRGGKGIFGKGAGYKGRRSTLL